MSIKREAIPLATSRPSAPSAIGLAYQLGELPLDLRRRGIPAIREQGGDGLRLEDGGREESAIRSEEPERALERLASGEDARIVGLTLQYRREAILVRADSPKRTIADLRGSRLGLAFREHPAEARARREAEGNVAIALSKAGLGSGSVIWVALPGNGEGGELQALLRGEVEAVYSSFVLPAETRKRLGVRELEDYVSYAPALTALTVSGEWIRRSPEEVDRVLAHASLAASWAFANRAEANRLAAKQLGLPENEIETVFSERLHKQFGLAVTDEKWTRLAHLKKELAASGRLERDFSLEAALDRERLASAQALIDAGEAEPPLSEPITPYAENDLPRSFFSDRRPARVLANDEEALEAARTFAEEIAPGASERDRGRKLPLREMQRFAELGLLGLVVPKSYGGPDVSTRTLVETFKIISQADGAIGQIPQNHHFFAKTIELVGDEEQKAFFFGEVLKGAQFGNALAERGIGKGGARKLATTVRKTPEEGVRELNGSKFYSTGALYSHWIPVTALDEEERRMTAFVPRHAPGVSVLDDWSGIGQRTTASGGVVLRGVRVPEAHLLHHYRIFEGPQYFSAFGQIMHAGIDIGIARAALEDAARYVREHTRPAYGSGAAKASEEPDLIRRFGELGIRLQAADALLDRAADAIDEARRDLNAETAGRASLTVDSAKWLVTETALEIANALFEVAGTSSMDRKHNYDRHWRNVRIHTLHDPARLKLHNVGKWFLNGEYHEYKF